MRRASALLTALVLASSLSLPSLAQQNQGAQPPMSAEQQAQMQAWMASMSPGAPHAALAARAGKWTAKISLWMDPAAPPTESTGTATREMILGGRVLQEKFQSNFMGMPMEGIGMNGYDNVGGTYWSTWNDNMSTGLMRMEGAKNADGSFTYKGSMLDPMSKKAVPVRIVSKEVSADKDTMEMYETRDGKENKTMMIVYERVK